MARVGDHGSSTKPAWRAPKVDDLGNLRDFVRTGGANGKSGTNTDGSSMPGHEAMNS
jgi:hypothetical protein